MTEDIWKISTEEKSSSWEPRGAEGLHKRHGFRYDLGNCILPLPKSPHQDPCEPNKDASFKEKLDVGISNFVIELQKWYPALAIDSAFEGRKQDGNHVQKKDLNPILDRQQEAKLRCLSMPLEGVEQKKFAKAFRAISKTIYRSICDQHKIEISPEGSYRHATNIPGSDIEVDVYFRESSSSRKEFSQFQQIRNLTERILVEKYGGEKVKRIDDMIFNINEGGSKISADILVAFFYKRFIEGKCKKKIEENIKEFYNDKGNHFVDQVDQGHINGVEKHRRTGRRFKQTIRIFKRLRNEMRDSPIQEFKEAAKNIQSLLIEAMIYYVPDNHFGHKYLVDDIKSIICYCIDHTRDDKGCEMWTRLYSPAPLFSKDRQQPGTQEELWMRERYWTREQAHKFLLAVQKYLGFNAEDLSKTRSQLREQVDRVSLHIKNFKGYMESHKEALTYALSALCIKKQVFDDILGNAVLCHDRARGLLDAKQPDPNELLKNHEILRSTNQGLDMIHRKLQKLLEKLMSVESSTQEMISLEGIKELFDSTTADRNVELS